MDINKKKKATAETHIDYAIWKHMGIVLQGSHLSVWMTCNNGIHCGQVYNTGQLKCMTCK